MALIAHSLWLFYLSNRFSTSLSAVPRNTLEGARDTEHCVAFHVPHVPCRRAESHFINGNFYRNEMKITRQDRFEAARSTDLCVFVCVIWNWKYFTRHTLHTSNLIGVWRESMCDAVWRASIAVCWCERNIKLLPSPDWFYYEKKVHKFHQMPATLILWQLWHFGYDEQHVINHFMRCEEGESPACGILLLKVMRSSRTRNADFLCRMKENDIYIDVERRHTPPQLITCI